MSTMPPDATTVVHMLAAAAKAVPGAEALVCDSDRLSYAGFVRCVAGFAQELQQDGVSGQRVALLLDNSVDMAIALFAVQAAGAQAVPLNPLATAAEIRPILDDAAPALVLAEPACVHLAAPWPVRACGMGGPRLTVWDDDVGAQPEWHDLPAPDSLASLQYTGGTTGRAKGVALSHAAIAANILQRDALLPSRIGAERVLSVAPLYHVYALAMGLHLAVHARGCLVIQRGYRRDALVDTLLSERITLFGGTPRLFTDLLEHPDIGRLRGGALRLCFSGSAALPEEILRRWEILTGVPVCEGYGQTEAGPVLTFNPAHGPRKVGSVGVAVPDTEVQIVDLQTGRIAQPIGAEGEIRARGPQIMRGYRNRPDETEAALRDGWLYTGDIGAFDADGYLFIRGRRKEMVIVSGFNVYPREVEEALHTHPAVAEAAVVGRPDDLRGEALVAFVALRADVEVSDLAGHLTALLSAYKRPAVIHVVADLPRTAVGKIDKRVLELRARERREDKR